MSAPMVATESFCPREARPRECQDALCEYRIEHAQGWSDGVFSNVAAVFIHKSSDKTDRYEISKKQMMDFDHDIWTDVVAWMKRLHGEVSA